MEGGARRGKPIKCRAAVCRGAEKPLVIEEVEVSAPIGYQVRVKIICTSLCHSDVTFWKMKEPPLGLFPRIFGHEAAGVVESVGELVTEVKEGDMVVPVFLANCGDCVGCRSEKGNICSAQPFKVTPESESVRGGGTVFRDAKGEKINTCLNVSSFSEYTLVDVCNLAKIDANIPFDKACLLSCGVSTGVGAAWKVARIEARSTVAVFGLGAVGLAVAEGARLCGAAKIIGVDLNSEKFPVAKKFGVTDFVNPKDCGDKSISEVIKEMTNGGADYSFECVGLTSVMKDAFNSSHDGWGKTVILGVEMLGAPLSIETWPLLVGKSICGCYFGGIKPKTDLPILAKRYLEKELQLDQFITHEVGFQDINKAFDLLLQGKSIRCVIWMDK